MKFMKTRHNTINLLAMGMLLVGLLSACTKDKINDGNNDVSNGGGRGFRAATEGDGSKTFLDGMTVKWEESDMISVRNSAGTAKGFSLEEGANTQYGSFNSAEAGDDFYSGNYTSIYPAASTAGTDNAITSATAATFDLPAVQTYKANSFGVKAMPMMAYSTDENLEFKNVLGGVVFPLTYSETGTSVHVTSVVVESNNTEDVLWGTCATTISGVDGAADLNSSVTNSATDRHIITLDCSADGGVKLVAGAPTDFTVMVPAGTLESGFTLRVFASTQYFPNVELYTQSVSWASGTHEGFIARSRLSKVNTNITMPLRTDYTVRYLDMSSDPLAEPTVMENHFIGEEITENPIDIDGYEFDHVVPSSTITLKADPSQNEICFYYKYGIPQYYTLTFKYMGFIGGKLIEILEDRIYTDIVPGTHWIEEAIEIPNFEVFGEKTIAFDVTEDGMVKIFLYRENSVR